VSVLASLDLANAANGVGAHADKRLWVLTRQPLNHFFLLFILQETPCLFSPFQPYESLISLQKLSRSHRPPPQPVVSSLPHLRRHTCCSSWVARYPTAEEAQVCSLIGKDPSLFGTDCPVFCMQLLIINAQCRKHLLQRTQRTTHITQRLRDPHHQTRHLHHRPRRLGEYGIQRPRAPGDCAREPGRRDTAAASRGGTASYWSGYVLSFSGIDRRALLDVGYGIRMLTGI
jgi:hypothetical protein